MQTSRPLFFLPFFILFLAAVHATAQVRLPHFPDTLFSTYYHQRVTHFRSLPQTKNDIVFLGNSITDGGEWSELFGDLRLKNRGISGDVSTGVLKRLDEVAKRKPAKVFLLIGVNDLAGNIPPDSVVKNILLIADYLKQETPVTKLFVQSLLPVNDGLKKFAGHTSKAVQIKEVNERLQQEAATHHYSYINLHDSFCNPNGKLKEELTNDGLHLTGKGYLLWKHLVYPWVYDLQKQPAMLPLPQKTQWKEGVFSLADCRAIVFSEKQSQQEALLLQEALRKKGLDIPVQNQQKGANNIVLQTGRVIAPVQQEEAYQLDITENGVVLIANTPHGLFNGIQTLLQLARDGVLLDACSIKDWPSFSWRGYMIDVGRNYMSLKLLKEQIDVMAHYKLNVFHFHPTEDIAWRIASKQYPQLTAPETMLRNKGQYYTEAEIKELISYCRQRYITFVPEIDMPGHSAAFRRAMHTDMQSDSGLAIVKNILKEFCKTYDVPFIHIGADEVKITNEKFVPEVTTLLKSLGKKVIGWEPGGNFSPEVIRQLWMDDNGKIAANKNIRYIDSRHLYVNHMDPLESVVTIFNRQICNKNAGDAAALGGTLCTWHDRAAGNEEDILRMNPVYPGLLAFAERCWQGGGKAGWIANVSDGDESRFREFESRLLDQKQLFFPGKPFPYVKQSNITWQLVGPYANGGDVKKAFAPETASTSQLKPVKQVSGGTVVLRHWWAPLIKGAIDQPEDSTTWYATTQFWSDEEGVQSFWIGFNNLSRSPATDSPPAGAWDNKESNVWVNGSRVAPPLWRRGGQKGLSEIPLIDEGYEYRQPARIAVKKGWNTVLIKAPVGSFKGRDWHNPVKWEFTFVPVED
ncbi:family 20 glycosylhydrolase [Flavisolibacter nicotianae]|uniref:family 20 glycosylhydrolase n=1 Tax=Flavisolibacter nicotianae TaxID=2364882 RepID=UPI000EAFECFD|nr:family 20 glycosylhydrolase [Flavisolibacter nicotianae]